MKTVAFIPARLNSTRLPRKHLRDLGGKPMLQWTVDELSKCGSVDEIVICAPDLSVNRELEKIRGAQFHWFGGKPDDIVTRMNCAAKEHDAEICVLVSGDCPLVDAEETGLQVEALKNNLKYAIEYICPTIEGVQVCTRTTWRRADFMSVSAYDRENQFPIIFDVKRRKTKFIDGRFRGLNRGLGDLHSFDKMSVDTEEELAQMRYWHSRLGAAFSLRNVVALINEEFDGGGGI